MILVFRIVCVLFFFSTLLSCASVDFVYNKKSNINNFKNYTKIVSNEDENKYLTSYLEKNLGNIKNGSKYTLTIKTKTIENVTSTNQDQSAASYYVNSIVDYKLTNVLRGCVIYFDIIETGFSYNAKSEGYNFGTDRSKEKNKKQNLQHNAEVFLNKVSSLPKDLACINEN